MRARRNRRVLFWLVIGLGVVVPLVLPLVGPGPVDIGQLFHSGFADTTAGKIFWQIRVPRVLLGYLVGAALALAGMVFQAVFRNPLATPFTLGVSSGASFGAAVAVKMGLVFVVLGVSGVALSSFVGAVATILLVYFLTSLRRRFSTEAMLLAGVALSFFFSAAILFIQYLSDFAGSYQLVRWLMGDLNTVGFAKPAQLALILVPSLVAILYFAPDLNLILAGDDLALTRGVNVQRVKVLVFFVVSLLTGAVVAFCGPIGFVGMMVPHFLRLLLGAEHRRLIWACVLVGGGFLVICDLVARTVIAPAEIPVGILTALLGGPFFLGLLIRGREGKLFF